MVYPFPQLFKNSGYIGVAAFVAWVGLGSSDKDLNNTDQSTDAVVLTLGGQSQK